MLYCANPSLFHQLTCTDKQKDMWIPARLSQYIQYVQILCICVYIYYSGTYGYVLVHTYWQNIVDTVYPSSIIETPCDISCTISAKLFSAWQTDSTLTFFVGPGQDLFNFMADKLREFMVEHQLFGHRYSLFIWAADVPKDRLVLKDTVPWHKILIDPKCVLLK